MGSGRSAEGISPSSVITEASLDKSCTDAEKPTSFGTPEQTRRLKFAPTALPPALSMRRVASSPGNLQQMPLTGGSLSRIKRQPSDDGSFDFNEACDIAKNLAASGAAVGSVMLAVCNAGAIADFFAATTAHGGANTLAALAASARDAALSDAHSNDHTLLSPLAGSVWATTEDNSSGSAAVEETGPSSVAGPIAAILITCMLALIALAVAKWPAPSKRAQVKTLRSFSPRSPISPVAGASSPQRLGGLR